MRYKPVGLNKRMLIEEQTPEKEGITNSLLNLGIKSGFKVPSSRGGLSQSANPIVFP